MPEHHRMARLSALKKDDRDRLVQQILDAAKALYERNLLRSYDLIVEQDDIGPSEERTGKPCDNQFYTQHSNCDVRVNVVFVVRAIDR
jgi:hypothetical protein